MKFVNMPNNQLDAQTCLCAAVHRKHIETVKYLLRVNEIDVHKSNRFEKTPWLYACEGGHLEIARVKYV